MSIATDRKALRDELASYPLMTIKQVSVVLQCSEDHVRGLLGDGVIPSVDIGRKGRHEYRVDPFAVAVFVLARQAGVTVEEFWDKHGPNGTVEHCRRLVQRIRRTAA